MRWSSDRSPYVPIILDRPASMRGFGEVRADAHRGDRVKDRIDVGVDASDELFGRRRTCRQSLDHLAFPHPPVLDVFVDHVGGVVDDRPVAGIEAFRAEGAYSLE